ncbi:MAG: DEAD/DEAH box helicase, partial [Saprospiraceae bacterium]
MSTFDDLNLSPSLRKSLAELGFEIPTPIQERTFSVAMSGRDVLGIAQTGTGKTLAYLLPCLRQWKYLKDRGPYLLVLVPTRELVDQVVRTVQDLAQYMQLKAVGVYGGTNIRTQMAEVASGMDVLVATPGRLIDLALNGAIKLRNVKKLVIDEVDEMLNLGFRAALTSIFDLLPPKRQNLLFSATLPDIVEALMAEFFNDPLRIEASPVGTPLENI